MTAFAMYQAVRSPRRLGRRALLLIVEYLVCSGAPGAIWTTFFVATWRYGGGFDAHLAWWSLAFAMGFVGQLLCALCDLRDGLPPRDRQRRRQLAWLLVAGGAALLTPVLVMVVWTLATGALHPVFLAGSMSDVSFLAVLGLAVYLLPLIYTLRRFFWVLWPRDASRDATPAP